MESLTIELVSNASVKLFPDNILRPFTNFLPEHINLKGQWEVAVSEKINPSMYQNVTDGNFMFYGKTLSNSSKLFYLEPGLYPFITDIDEVLTILIQERQNQSKNCIKVEVSQRTQKVEFYLANEGSGLAFF